MALPLASDPFGAQLAPPDANIVPNILIVDDRKENLLATEKVLRTLHARLFKATSGNEALSLMIRHPFALVLLDVQMPEMDGFEVAMLMQEHEVMRHIPIIFATAISKEEKYATQAAELGAVDYIFKPINPEILKSKVKVYLDLYVQREYILGLNAVLQQSNQELERFAYACSHDLQEPVRMINIYAGILEKKCAELLDPKGRQHLHNILMSADRIRKMIQDILAFSRVGREEIQYESVDCNEIVREVLAEFESTIQEKKANVIINPLPTFSTSTTLIRVLLQNLIGNALKFEDGSRPLEIEVSAVREGIYWRFAIRDTGIGIDPQYHERIFVLFQRLHGKEQYPGTGIGLSTCKKFLQLCGGDIWLESALGKGTTFFFTLPASNHTKG